MKTTSLHVTLRNIHTNINEVLSKNVMFIDNEVTICVIYTWVIEVVLSFLCFFFLFWGERFVETVEADCDDLPLSLFHLMLTKFLHDLVAYRRLKYQTILRW